MRLLKPLFFLSLSLLFVSCAGTHKRLSRTQPNPDNGHQKDFYAQRGNVYEMGGLRR